MSERRKGGKEGGKAERQNQMKHSLLGGVATITGEVSTWLPMMTRGASGWVGWRERVIARTTIKINSSPTTAPPITATTTTTGFELALEPEDAEESGESSKSKC